MIKSDHTKRATASELFDNDRKSLQTRLVELVSLYGFIYGGKKSEDATMSDAQKLAHILDVFDVLLAEFKALSQDKEWER